VSWLALIVYTVADHVAFQLLKLARNDFIYWVPGVGGIVSSVCRVVAKVLVDFTGMFLISLPIEIEIRLINLCAVVAGLVHFRHPLELGGAYYFFNTIMNQLSVFVAAFIYWQYYIPPTAAVDILRAVLNATGTNSSASNVSAANLTNAPVADLVASAANSTPASSTGAASTAGKIDLITLVASVGTLFAVWAVAALGVWFTMKPEYRRTFWSTRTGYAFSQSYFLDNEGNDAKRIEIFAHNERHWRAIRDRVRQWVLAMYAAWQALQPVWFTDAVKAQIPDAFIPTEALRRENARAGGWEAAEPPVVCAWGRIGCRQDVGGWGVAPAADRRRRGRRRCSAERTGSPVGSSQRLQLVPQPTHRTFLEPLVAEQPSI
jgi:hypothetical protein